MTFVSDLKPRELWRHFDKILSIPRGSKNEAAMIEYVTETAANHSLFFKKDEVGNIVVSKPGTAGSGQAPITILQSHLDMVCEKNADVESALKEALQEKEKVVFIDFITDKTEDVYPMIAAGKGHHEMHLSPKRELA